MIGVQSGPPGRRVHSGFHEGHGGRVWDAGCGDDREDPPGVFRSEEADQGDLPRAAGVAEGRAQGDPVGGDGVSLRARPAAAAEDRPVAGAARRVCCWRTRRKAARERLTLIRIFEELRGLGYEGGYDAVRRYAKSWRGERGAATAEAYVPLSFAPGEAYQFDWSHEIVLINGVTVTVKVAHVRLCHSRMLFVRAYPRETPGDGVRRPRPGLRLLQGRLHARHLRQHEDGGGDGVRRQGPPVQPPLPADVQPLPGRAGGLHAGVGLGEGAGREPGRAGARALLHAAAAGDELRGAERLAARPMRRLRQGAPASRAGRPDDLGGVRGGAAAAGADHAAPSTASTRSQASVSKTCLVRFDNNKYSVASRAVGRPVEIQAYADRIVIRQDGAIVGEHRRCFGRGETIYDPWHYVPVLARKPGALRNGAPFKDWVCRPAWSGCGAS